MCKTLGEFWTCGFLSYMCYIKEKQNFGASLISILVFIFSLPDVARSIFYLFFVLFKYIRLRIRPKCISSTYLHFSADIMCIFLFTIYFFHIISNRILLVCNTILRALYFLYILKRISSLKYKRQGHSLYSVNEDKIVNSKFICVKVGHIWRNRNISRTYTEGWGQMMILSQ